MLPPIPSVELSKVFSLHRLFAATLLLTIGGLAWSQSVMPWIASPRGDDNWYGLHVALKDRFARAKPDVLFVGDSLTARWAATGKPYWDRAFAPLNAFNAGIGGETTQGLLWRMSQSEFVGASPNTVVLMIGTNNLNSSDAPSIAKGIRAVAEGFGLAFASARIILLSILPREGPRSANRTKLVRINDELRRDAPSSRYTFCDIGQLLLKDDGELIDAAFLPDGLHLSAVGYERIVDEVARTISGKSRNCSPPQV